MGAACRAVLPLYGSDDELELEEAASTPRCCVATPLPPPPPQAARPSSQRWRAAAAPPPPPPPPPPRRAAAASTGPSQKLTCWDAHVAASLQAEDWNREAHREQADAAVAASLQAETWRQETVAASLQAEAWQVCSQRVTQHARACPLLLEDASARPPTAELPLEEEVHSAAGQLRWRLSDYGLRAREIVGDGACQFRAVADQLFGDQELRECVRARALAQLRSCAAKYEGFAVGESFEEYLARMAEPSTWGDNLSLQAVADAFDIEACLVTSFLERSFICVRPCSGQPVQQIWLGFYAEYHYTSLEPAD